MRHCKAPSVLALAILTLSEAFAANPKTILKFRPVCWGESVMGIGCSDQFNPYPGKPEWIHFPCGSGGKSAFNKDVVCNKVCFRDPKDCAVVRGIGGSAGSCRFRWAQVACGEAFAANPKTILKFQPVCWGESVMGIGCSNQFNPYPGKPEWIHFPCGSGGKSDFNKAVVCNRVCFRDPKDCAVVRGIGGSAGSCRFRWAEVACGL
jgi:hypothetical protein